MTSWHGRPVPRDTRMTRFDWLLLAVLLALNFALLAYRVVW